MKGTKMVRFFETQKSERKLKQRRKQLLEANTNEEKEEASSLVRKAELDKAYVTYYPLSAPYVALFATNTKRNRGKSSEVDEESSPARCNTAVYSRIEEAMAKGKSALEQIRNELVIVEDIGFGYRCNESEPMPPEDKASNEEEFEAQDGDQTGLSFFL